MKSRYTNVKYHCEISQYFSVHRLKHSLRNYKEEAEIKPSEKALPASIATLAQRQPLRWANVSSPTLAQHGFVNWPNGGPTVACQRCANIGPMLAH